MPNYLVSIISVAVINIVLIAIGWGKLSERIKTLFNKITALEKSESELREKNDLLKDKLNENSLEDEKRHNGLSESMSKMKDQILKSMQDMFNQHSGRMREDFKVLETRIHDLAIDKKK